VRISAALPSGVTALLFEAAAARRALEQRLVPYLESAGFTEALLPILDYAEPYEPLLAPRRRAELYRFVDRGGELLALRADFTPLLARLLAPRLGALPSASLPLRLFYRGDVVRYGAERPGRRRELYQLGAECIGGDGADGERGMLQTFLELLTAADVPVRVAVGFAGAVDELLVAGSSDPTGLAAAIERRERGAARAAAERAHDRAASLLAIVEQGVPADPEHLGARAPALRAALALVDDLRRRFPALDLAVDLAEFAGHAACPALRERSSEGAYYDGLMFRAYVGTDTVPVGSGGRYDGLFRRLGSDVAASGFSLGLDRMLESAAAGGGA
jgi:ATP phosphoribosyltransferase regulatory subunit